MAKKLNGSIPFAPMFKPTGGQPLDDRVVVAKIADLHDKDTFGDTSYRGMMVVVDEDNNIYVLTDEVKYRAGESTTESSAWKWVNRVKMTPSTHLAVVMSKIKK